MPRGSKPGERRGGRAAGAVNKVTADIRAAALVHGADAIVMLATIMTTSENDSARIAAAKELLDRAYGKSTMPVEVSGPDGGPIRTSLPVKFVEPHE
jgi:hypothetical protein